MVVTITGFYPLLIINTTGTDASNPGMQNYPCASLRLRAAYLSTTGNSFDDENSAVEIVNVHNDEVVATCRCSNTFVNETQAATIGHESEGLFALISAALLPAS